MARKNNKRKKTSTAPAPLSIETQQKLANIKCALTHAHYTDKFVRSLNELFCLTEKDQQVALEELLKEQKNLKLPTSSLDTPIEQIEFLKTVLGIAAANEINEAKNSPENTFKAARPYTRTYEILDEALTIFKDSPTPKDSKEKMIQFISMRRRDIPAYRNVLLAAEIVLTVEPKRLDVGYRYTIEDKEIIPSTIKKIFETCDIKNPKYHKGKIFILSKSDNNIFSKYENELPELLKDETRDPLEILKTHFSKETSPDIKEGNEAPKDDSPEERSENLESIYNISDQLDSIMTSANIAQEIYGLGKGPDKEGELAQFLDTEHPFDPDKESKISYLRRQAKYAIEKFSGVDNGYLTDFINDIEKNDGNLEELKEIIASADAKSKHLDHILCGPYIISSAVIKHNKNNKKTGYNFTNPTTVENIRKSLNSIDIKPNKLIKMPKKPREDQYFSLVLDEDENNKFLNRCKIIQDIVNDKTQDPIAALLETHPLKKTEKVQKPVQAVQQVPTDRELRKQQRQELEKKERAEKLELAAEKEQLNIDVSICNSWITAGNEKLKKKTGLNALKKSAQKRNALKTQRTGAEKLPAKLEERYAKNNGAYRPQNPDTIGRSGNITDRKYKLPYNKNFLSINKTQYKKTPWLLLEEGTKRDEYEKAHNKYIASSLNTAKNNDSGENLMQFSASPTGLGYPPYLSQTFGTETKKQQENAAIETPMSADDMVLEQLAHALKR